MLPLPCSRHQSHCRRRFKAVNPYVFRGARGLRCGGAFHWHLSTAQSSRTSWSPYNRHELRIWLGSNFIFLTLHHYMTRRSKFSMCRVTCLALPGVSWGKGNHDPWAGNMFGHGDSQWIDNSNNDKLHPVAKYRNIWLFDVIWYIQPEYMNDNNMVIITKYRNICLFGIRGVASKVYKHWWIHQIQN